MVKEGILSWVGYIRSLQSVSEETIDDNQAGTDFQGIPAQQCQKMMTYSVNTVFLHDELLQLLNLFQSTYQY